MYLLIVVINKGISDNGHFVQCLTSLISYSPSINLTEECIDFYRKAFDDNETEVKLLYFNKFKFIFLSLDSYSCISMS